MDVSNDMVIWRNKSLVVVTYYIIAEICAADLTIFHLILFTDYRILKLCDQITIGNLKLLGKHNLTY